MDVIERVIDNIHLIFIVFCRISGFFSILPIFGRRTYPAMGKIVLAFFTSLILLPMVNDAVNIRVDNLWLYTALVFHEIAIGFVLGFAVYIMFVSIYIAGQMIDMQMGFGIVNVLDPQTNIQVPIMGNFYYILTLLIFLTINGHHILLLQIIESYRVISPGEGIFNEALLWSVVKIFGQMFLIGFKIAMPVVGAVYLTDVALGITARTVPQMNVFIVGLPLKILMGIIVIMFVLPMYLIVLDGIFSGTYKNFLMVLKAMLPRW